MPDDVTAPSDQPVTRVRLPRTVREYGWLAAAVGLGVVVLLCSLPFVSGPGLTWHSAEPVSATPSAPVETSAPATHTAAPSPSAAPTTAKPTPSRSATRAPRRQNTTTAAAPRPVATTAAAPTLLGPQSADGLWQLVGGYCQRDEAWARPGENGDGNWWCLRWNRDPQVADMTAACRNAFGGGAFAETSNRRDPFAWRCYRR